MSDISHGPELSPTVPIEPDSKVPTEDVESTPPLNDLSGELLDGRYALGEILGAGGMGAVFEAWDLLLDRSVAVKVIRSAYAEHEDYVKRFMREAQAASKVQHRNVVVNLDYGETTDGLVYSVMERLVGQDLKQLLKQSPNERLPWSRACELLIQIASGLKAAHDQGVIHRDIKPANCFVTTEDGQPVVKLVDFGIAKLDKSSEVEQITQTSQVLGTPSYIAPELVRSKVRASPRSDVYSMGVLAYRMLTGSLPFIGETPFEVMYRACTESVPRPRKQAPELPSDVEELVLAMLAKKPEHRPADMAVVRQRLQVLAQCTGTRQRSRMLPVIAGVLLATTIIFAGWPAADRTNEPTDARHADLDKTIENVASACASQTSSGTTNPPSECRGPTATVDAATTIIREATPLEYTSARTDSVRSSKEATENHPLQDLKRSQERQASRKNHTNRKDIPPDSILRNKLARKIKTRCGDLMKGRRITVFFTLTTSGRIEDPTAMPKDTSGRCAIEQLQDMRFRSRRKKAIVRITSG
ncbi:MAG: serine/threonine-protein kinase [Myxococcota bacterium]